MYRCREQFKYMGFRVFDFLTIILPWTKTDDFIYLHSYYIISNNIFCSLDKIIVPDINYLLGNGVINTYDSVAYNFKRNRVDVFFKSCFQKG